MSMIRRAISGQIENYTDEGEDKALVCQACNRIIVSKVNLEANDGCPFCHNNINQVLSTSDNLMVEPEPEDIAESI